MAYRRGHVPSCFFALPIFLVLLVLVAAGPAWAQAGQASAGVPPGPVSAVAYVDILPASRAQAIDEIRKYRETSRVEAGFLGLDVFEQQRRGAYFVIIETWASAAAIDAHAKASHVAAFRAAMVRLGISGYDERPYAAFVVAPMRPANPQTVYVVTHVDTIPAPGTDPQGILRALAERSRTEPGNLRFDVLQHTVRRNHFTVVEAWENPAALDAHAAAAGTKQYRLAILPLTGSPLDERIYRAVE